MANSIALASKYISMIDEKYATAATSSVLEKPNFVQYFDGGNAVKILKVATQYLGDYSRENGYAKGSISATWETHTLTQDRGRKFSLDVMDNEETLGLTLGAAMKDFQEQGVTPEVDAYRYAKLAEKAGLSVSTASTLTKANAKAAIDDAIAEMKENRVPLTGAKLFITPTNLNFLKNSDAYTFNIDAQNANNVRANFVGTYDTLAVIEVPQLQFYTAIEQLDGSTKTDSADETAGGYKKATAGNDINFMIVADNACLPVVKHQVSNIITPENNPDADAYILKYRLYHDIFVPDNKTKGIYLHNKAE